MGRDPGDDAGFASVDWNTVVARIVTGTGWHLDHVLDELDLPTVRLLFGHWEHSPPAAESLASIERMLAGFFGVAQRPSPAEPARPAQVADLQSIPGMAQGEPIKWMSAEEFLRRRDQLEAEAHGNG